MDLRLADNALFADLALSGLKLRLDQVGNMAVLGQQAGNDRQYQLEGNKRHVDDAERRRFLQHIRRYIADIGALHALDTRILPQTPRQLAIADVNGIHLARTAAQQAVGKAAGRCANVHHDQIGRVDVKVVERLLDLLAAAGHKCVLVAANLQFGVFVNHIACFARLLACNVDDSLHNRSLCALP